MKQIIFFCCLHCNENSYCMVVNLKKTIKGIFFFLVRCRGREKLPFEASDVFWEEEEGQNSKEVNCSWVNVDFCSAIALAIASRTVPEDTLKETFNNRNMHSSINWKSSSFNHSCCPIYLHILNIARHKTRITTFSLICTLSTLVNTNNGNT